MRERKAMGTAAALGLALALGACSSVYYSVWEKLGKEKRDLLRDNVEGVRKDQEDVSEQFESTLERIRAIYGLDGRSAESGDLEKQYDRLQGDYDRSVERAEELRERIERVEDVARDLFREWEREIDEISDADLRRRSRSQLEATRGRYRQLSAALARTEAGLDPVLTKFKDQVLFLKHNLNAQAIGSLAAEMRSIERDVDDLLGDLRVSIREADRFIDGLPD